ncbi:MAG: prevent-host-death protein [Zetaproteobacteria bacterium CG1_02_53_45]|nr:MAG: prevent-host-death protein [Zetaproteobacteria bacterium CG1_02_53_45]
MQTMAAKEAKIHFGELMDTVQREPVSIKKYGRDVAVVMSAEAYRQLKLERLRARLSIGELQLDRGNAVDGRTFFQELEQSKP